MDNDMLGTCFLYMTYGEEIFGRKDIGDLREKIRAHWQIENSCHWQLDTTFREDANQTRAGNVAKNLGTVRRIVLNLLNHDNSTIKSLPKKRRQALLNLSYRESTLSSA